MQTKFTFKSYLIPLLTGAFALIILNLVPTFFYDPYYDDKLFPKIFVPSISVFSFFYLVFGEFRTKNIKVVFDKNQIKVKRFYGLKTDVFQICQILGWKYSFLRSRHGQHEYLYLYNLESKKIIKISEFYHKNYFQIKNHIQINFPDLGFEPFSMGDEFKEIFK
jgi:hypothetical protein